MAAVGQTNLVEAYDRTLRNHGRHAAQILLIADDLDNRARYLNIRNTILTLLEFGAVPIINENDTVSVEELQTTFGDNDRLAAMVTNLIRAPLLVLLSDVEGLYDGDPADPQSRIIPTVTRLDDSIWSLVRDKATGLSKGGMASKLEAARVATTAGENVIIASGKQPGALQRILAGESVGHFVRGPRRYAFELEAVDWLYGEPAANSAWMTARAARSHDWEAACWRLEWSTCKETFRKGDVVKLCDRQGREFARGLTNYTAEEVTRIKGLHTGEIAAALGHCPYDEVIHRDNLAATGSGGKPTPSG